MATSNKITKSSAVKDDKSTMIPDNGNLTPVTRDADVSKDMSVVCDTCEISEPVQDLTNNESETDAAREKASDEARIEKERPRLSLDTRVKITNGYHGTLVIPLPRMKTTVTLLKFGDSDFVDLAELFSLRSSNPAFFEGNYILIEDPDVILYLNAESFYKNALTAEGLGSFFALTEAEMVSTIELLSDTQKRVIAIKAVARIKSGEIDSNKTIKVLEESLGYDLTGE